MEYIGSLLSLMFIFAMLKPESTESETLVSCLIQDVVFVIMRNIFLFLVYNEWSS